MLSNRKNLHRRIGLVLGQEVCRRVVLHSMPHRQPPEHSLRQHPILMMYPYTNPELGPAVPFRCLKAEYLDTFGVVCSPRLEFSLRWFSSLQISNQPSSEIARVVNVCQQEIEPPHQLAVLCDQFSFNCNDQGLNFLPKCNSHPFMC